MKRSKLHHFIITTLVAITIQGCANVAPKSSRSVELGDILVPVKDSLTAIEKKPLKFPATVALLMVPGTNRSEVPNSTLRIAAEALKKELLKNTNYVSSVPIVNTDDTQRKMPLSTIRDLYGADVVIILSYEQDQRRTQNSFFAFLDAAILPAFVIPSVKVTTSTVVDGKVIHIPSNAIIFRSSGVDEKESHITSFTSGRRQADEETIATFVAATKKFGENVSGKLANLDKFDMSQAVSMNTLIDGQAGVQKKVRDPNDQWAKVDTYKSSGGGAFGILDLLLLGCVVLFWIIRARHLSHRKSVDSATGN